MTRYCATGHDPVWWTSREPCWICGGRGRPATGPYAPARSWSGADSTSPSDVDLEIA